MLPALRTNPTLTPATTGIFARGIYANAGNFDFLTYADATSVAAFNNYSSVFDGGALPKRKRKGLETFRDRKCQTMHACLR